MYYCFTFLTIDNKTIQEYNNYVCSFIIFIDNLKRNRYIKRLFNCKHCNEYIIPFATYVSIPMQKYMSTVPEICELKKHISTYNKNKNNWEKNSSESKKSNDIFIKNYEKMIKQLNSEYAKVSKKVY